MAIQVPGPEAQLVTPQSLPAPVWYERLKALFSALNLITAAAEFDKAGATAGQTGLLLWDVDNGTVERVSVGAADSGGTGFKVLRIPN